MNILNFFEETVQRFPQKTAIAYKEISYSFSDLSHQAKCLAERILQAGQTGKPVGVFVNRGADTAVLFLAVLYSGNYYIPIDPDMPSAKISSILTDAEPSVILCGEENKPVLEEIHYSGTIYTLDDRSSEECPVCESIGLTGLYGLHIRFHRQTKRCSQKPWGCDQFYYGLFQLFSPWL